MCKEGALAGGEERRGQLIESGVHLRIKNTADFGAVQLGDQNIDPSQIVTALRQSHVPEQVKDGDCEKRENPNDAQPQEHEWTLVLFGRRGSRAENERNGAKQPRQERKE